MRQVLRARNTRNAMQRTTLRVAVACARRGVRAALATGALLVTGTGVGRTPHRG